MATTTTIPDTASEPRIALGVSLKRPGPGLATIADVAVALNVLTALIGDEDDLPLDIPSAHHKRINAVAVVEYNGAPVIISAGSEGALHNWHLDGTPGPLQVSEGHVGPIDAMTVLEHEGARLIITANMALCSWHVDGTPGELQVIVDLETGPINALAVVENNGAALVITGGLNEELRSWRLDGTPGELQVSNTRIGSITALAVVEDDGAPLIISAGDDGGCAAGAWTARRVSCSSPKGTSLRSPRWRSLRMTARR
jgi:WD40 repeat protein